MLPAAGLACCLAWAGSPIDVEHYAFRLTLGDDGDAIAGETSIRVRYTGDTASEVVLDLIGEGDATTGMIVDSVTRDGAPVGFEHADDRLRLRLASSPAAGDRHTWVVSYRGVPADGLIISTNRHGARTFFGDNWPDRARHWLPCVDHVSDKATVEFIVDAPDHYQVIANGRLREETDLPGGRRRTHWGTDHPLPTKVMVIGVASFAVQHLGEVDGVPVQSWVYAADRDAGFHDFAQAPRILSHFVERIGPFPYGKLANVQSTTRYGGMENASAIFYGERTVTGTRSNETLLAHEIAHQWFGDSVTESDWPHVWLSEGFATYLTQTYLEDTYGRERLAEGMRSASHRIFRFARRRPGLPVIVPEIDELTSLLNANSYQKGAWVLHMLRREVGDDAFWRGLREFHRAFRHGNASTGDLRAIMEHAAERELGWFFRQWLYEPGHPKIEWSWDWNPARRRLDVTVRQVQESGVAFRLSPEIAIHIDGAAAPRRETLDVRELVHGFEFELESDRAPSAVVLDPDLWVLMETSVRSGREM